MQDPIKASLHTANFGGYSYGSGVVMVLLHHMISQDHVTKGLCDFTGESSSW